MPMVFPSNCFYFEKSFFRSKFRSSAQANVVSLLKLKIFYWFYWLHTLQTVHLKFTKICDINRYENAETKKIKQETLDVLNIFVQPID